MSLAPESLVPNKGMVLLRSIWPDKSDGGIVIPLEHRPRWSPLGVVVASSGYEGLEPGDMVIIDDDSHHIERSYYDVFRIHLRDHHENLQIIVPIEAEPGFREIMEKFYREPSVYRDYYISVKDVSRDEDFSFQPPDVVEYSLDWEPNPTYRLDYMPTVMMNLWTGDKYELFYLIDEKRLLATLKA